MDYYTEIIEKYKFKKDRNNCFSFYYNNTHVILKNFTEFKNYLNIYFFMESRKQIQIILDMIALNETCINHEHYLFISKQLESVCNKINTYIALLSDSNTNQLFSNLNKQFGIIHLEYIEILQLTDLAIVKGIETLSVILNNIPKKIIEEKIKKELSSDNVQFYSPLSKKFIMIDQKEINNLFIIVYDILKNLNIVKSNNQNLVENTYFIDCSKMVQ